MIVYIDVETSGLNFGEHTLLSIGAIANGKEFYEECRAHDGAVFSERAFEINGFTKESALDETKPEPREIVGNFIEFCKKNVSGNEMIVLAGENVGSFDVKFLEHYAYEWPFGHRYLDLHSVAFSIFGESMSMYSIVERLEVEHEPEVHNALEGAKCAKRCFDVLMKRRNK